MKRTQPIMLAVKRLSARPPQAITQGAATYQLRRLRLRLDDNIPIIGVGGISSGADAVGKVSAGAQLVQIYTGFIYHGPQLIGECVTALRRRKEGVA